MMPSLELALTQELVNELARRYPTLLIAGEAARNEEYDNNLFMANGDLGALVTLAHVLDTKLTRMYMHLMEPTDDTL